MPRPQLITPNTSVQNQRPCQWNRCCESAPAAVAMMISSNVDQPTFCATLRPVGR